MNSELKLVVFEEKKVLQELLELLDEQYEVILSKELVALGKITSDIEKLGKNIASIELKRRNLIKGDFKSFIEKCDDNHLIAGYNEIKIILKNLELQKNTNETLIKQRLFFTNKMINVIKPSKSIGIYNSYGKVGR